VCCLLERTLHPEGDVNCRSERTNHEPVENDPRQLWTPDGLVYEPVGNTYVVLQCKLRSEWRWWHSGGGGTMEVLVESWWWHSGSGGTVVVLAESWWWHCGGGGTVVVLTDSWWWHSGGGADRVVVVAQWWW